jgi:DNA sulfur modification protein DndE
MLMESVRVTKQARDQLINLKRKTRIENWNALCRWSFCLSLSDPSPPREQKLITDSSIEMSWRTFGGENEEIFEALLRQRCKADGLPMTDDCLTQQFRLHLHRGISLLAGEKDLDSVEKLLRKALHASDPSLFDEKH